MSLRTEFETSGAWLFRHRSHLPLLALPIVVAGLSSFTYFAHDEMLDDAWGVLCLLVSLAGLGVRVLTIGYAPKGTSGRNTQTQVAQVLNTTGMYSLVRHPLYLGNYLIVLGLALFFHTWWMVVCATCLYALYYERIMFAEEAYLRNQFGETFEAWAAITPAIVPRLNGWKQPALSFSWRNVLRREYTGLFGIVAMFLLLSGISESLVERRIQVDPLFIGLFCFAGVVYLTLRTLKKRSKILDVPGR
jgi:protein-S-isoprenylcysteine O-methyltransferase Ste14